MLGSLPNGEQMKNLTGDDFQLTALPNGLSEQFMEAVLEDMDEP